ncbi:MAG: pilus assembly FimT family protein [Gemmatimonadales bacterium]
MAILGILVAAAIGGVSLINNRRLAGAARALGTDVRWVIQRAETERRCWRIEFDPPGEHYHIQHLLGGSWTPGGGCSGGTWTDYTSVAGRFFARGVDLLSTTFTSNIMTVSPFGGMNAGLIILQSPGGEQRRVDVNDAGRVLIFQ